MKFLQDEGSRIAFYITNPFSPAMRMVLPEEYWLKMDAESSLHDICKGIFDHTYHLYKKYNLIAYAYTEHYIQSQYTEELFKIVSTYIFHLVTNGQSTETDEIYRLYPRFKVNNGNIDLNTIDSIVFVSEYDKFIPMHIPDNLDKDTLIVMRTIILGVLPYTWSRMYIDRIVDNHHEDEDVITMYRLSMNNPRVPITLPASYNLQLPDGTMHTDEFIDLLINHMKHMENEYGIDVYPELFDLPSVDDVIDITFSVLKRILDKLLYEEITDDEFGNCTGATLIYDTTKKCMGYQDPNAIIGIRLIFSEDDGETYTNSQYKILDGKLLSDVIDDLKILLKLLPPTTNLVDLTTEDMKYII